MNILAMETTGAHASCALINEYGTVTELVSQGVLNHLQSIVPMVSELLEKCQLTIDDVDAIAVSEGPGSFTGIRIGVSTARALSQATGKPVIGVPTLETFLYHGETSAQGNVICPIFDARRSQIYGAAYFSGKEIVAGGAYGLDQYLSLLKAAVGGQETAGPFLFFGDGIAAYGQQIKEWNEDARFAGEEIRLQRAASVAKLALKLCQEGRVKNYEDLKPNYMRKAEAERKLEEGTGNCG